MATIRIKRRSEFVNLGRYYKLIIDGCLAGEIGDGVTKEFPTTAGRHTVRAKMDWFSSQDISIDISSDETKCLTVGCSKNAKWLASSVPAVVFLYPVLRGIMGFDYAGLLFLIPLALLLVYSTVGRKKYLILSETDDD